MTIKELKKQKEDIIKELNLLFKDREKINDKILQRAKVRDELESDIAKILIKNNKYDWEWLLYSDERGKPPERRTKLLEELDKMSPALKTSGYIPKTNQVCISITVEKDTNLEQLRDALEVLVPYLKPVKNNKIYIDIFERTLSENGVYYMYIDKETLKANVRICRYSRNSNVTKEDTLLNTLKVIQERFYYE